MVAAHVNWPKLELMRVFGDDEGRNSILCKPTCPPTWPARRRVISVCDGVVFFNGYWVILLRSRSLILFSKLSRINQAQSLCLRKGMFGIKTSKIFQSSKELIVVCWSFRYGVHILCSSRNDFRVTFLRRYASSEQRSWFDSSCGREYRLHTALEQIL